MQKKMDEGHSHFKIPYFRFASARNVQICYKPRNWQLTISKLSEQVLHQLGLLEEVQP